MKSLGPVLLTLHNLVHLNLASNSMKETYFSHFIDMNPQLPKLKSLNVVNNQIEFGAEDPKPKKENFPELEVFKFSV